MTALQPVCSSDNNPDTKSPATSPRRGRRLKKTVAPVLTNRLRYHVFFLYHSNDHDWVVQVAEKLEGPAFGFKCCCLERDLDPKLSLFQVTQFGIHNSRKTVLVLSPDFMSDVWNNTEPPLLSERDVLLIHKDLIVILLHDCDIPSVLVDLVYVDICQDDWWTHLVTQLQGTPDTPPPEDASTVTTPCLGELNPELQSGHLLASLRSRCRCCGREVIDPNDIPEELIAHGIQIPPEEYRAAVQHLMSDVKFRCHVWCYNVPAAIVFFTLLLGACLAVIPLLESRLLFKGSETGLEFVHGGILWLCTLTIYMVVVLIAKRQMKLNTYKRLTQVNATLVKYNLLAGVENLGMADCNKYYLHLFYFEMGPCLAYLQEQIINMEDCAATCFQNPTAQIGDATIELECETEHVTASNDTSRVLDGTHITNSCLQTQAEDLILQHSGEYIAHLITKKLSRPRRQRHVRSSLCLCQFIEQRVYKIIV